MLTFLLALFQVTNDLQELRSWKPIASTGVSVDLNQVQTEHGPGIELKYNYNGQGGFVLAQHAFPTPSAKNWEFTFWIKADSPDNDFEFKVMDVTGNSVWWVKRPAYIWPKQWTRMVIRRSQLVYAWGPDRSELPQQHDFQFGIAANAGGRGSVTIAGLEFRETEVPKPFTGRFTAPGYGPTGWSAGPTQPHHLDLRLEDKQQIGAIELQGLKPQGAKVELSARQSGGEWVSLKEVSRVFGKKVIFDTPELEADELRIRIGGARDVGLSKVILHPADFSRSPQAFYENLALNMPRGWYPKQMLRIATPWAVVGAVRSSIEALVSENGQVELDRMSPSIEPFLWHKGKLISWADVTAKQSLLDNHLPLPTVTWPGTVKLEVSPFACEGGSDQLTTRYRLINTTKSAQKVSLFVALRPIQVLPTWQFLNVNPLVAKVEQVQSSKTGFTFNGNRKLVFSEMASAVGCTTLGAGDIGPWISSGKVPPEASVIDPENRATGVARFDITLPVGSAKTISVTDLRESGRAPITHMAATQKAWREELNKVSVTLPGEAQKWADVYLSNLGWILVNKDGAAIQPGSRNYQRTWIRDGSLTATALLQVGHFSHVRELIKWYATGVQPDGWVPCVMDKRGPDPLAEHDSHGQFLFLVAEYTRFSQDKSLVQSLYPVIKRVAHKIESLIASEPELGILPRSASHEGYMDNHRYSFWDDFFAVKGLRDASMLADLTGNAADSRQWKAAAETLIANMKKAISKTQAEHKITYIPGCVELGDFDATSTAIGIYPCEGLTYLNFESTFDKYWQYVQDRAANTIEWRDYTPYEVRNIGAFVLLGHKDRAHFLMNWFARDLRPFAWNQWAEVAFKDPTPGRWLGDMPHTWVGSDFMKSFRTMFIAERPQTKIIDLNLGVPARWRSGTGASYRDFRTHYGSLSMTAKTTGKTTRYQFSGQLRGAPLLVLHHDFAKSAVVNGKSAKVIGNTVQFNTLPATIVINN